MPNGRDDIEFGFNPEPFVNGFKKMNESMAHTEKNTENMVKKISQGMTNAVMKIGAVTAGFLGVKAIIARIPEVGMVFKQAGDIFFKNLLWPLRKELMPLLQGILNWVRDNRGQFVVWGQTIANVFKVILTVGKEIFEVAKAIGSAFLNLVNNIFGSQIKNFDELLNVLSFKFALIAEFIGGILKGITKSDFFTKTEEIVGKILNLFVQLADAFVKGFGKNLPDLEDTFKSMADSMSIIIDKLYTGEDALEGWKTVFTTIGELVGNTVTALSQLMKALSFVVKGDEAGYEKWYNSEVEKQKEKDKRTEQARRFENVKKGIGLYNKRGEYFELSNDPRFGKYVSENGYYTNKIDDALITKKGDVIKLNPEDNILATKGNAGKSVTVNFGAINLNVTEGNAKTAGVNFIDGIYDGIRSRLNLELIGAGY